MKDESHYYYLQCYRSKSDGVSVARCQLLIPIQLSILSITIDYQLPILYARSFLMALNVCVCVCLRLLVLVFVLVLVLVFSI